jgi:predicted alpha/beta-hydrolase family hydrolase
MFDPIKVWVGPQFIGMGVPRSKTLCAVATALNFKGIGPATVDMDYIRTRRHAFKTPPSVADAILKMDTGLKVEPFGFELEKPEKVPA